MNSIELYEKKIIEDKEFPIQLQLRKITNSGTYAPEHWHEHLELLYILEGKTNVEINGTVISVEKGDLIVVNGNELHGCFGDQIPVSIMVISFEMETLAKEFAEKHIIFQALIRDDKEIAHMVTNIVEENEQKNMGYKLICKGYVLQLIAYLCRNYASEMLTDTESAKRRRNLERLNIVLQYINKHFSEEISVEELAELIHLSEGRFSHLFKENVGMSALKYINEVRIRKADALLQNETLTIAEVASYVGISNYGYFGKMYKRYYGYAPGERRTKV